MMHAENIRHIGDDIAFALYERLELREERGVKGFLLRFSFYNKMFCHDVFTFQFCVYYLFRYSISAKVIKIIEILSFS